MFMGKIQIIQDEDLLKFWQDQILMGMGQNSFDCHDSWCKQGVTRINIPKFNTISENYNVSTFTSGVGRRDFHIIGSEHNFNILDRIDDDLYMDTSLSPVVGFGCWSGYGLPSLDYFAFFSKSSKPVCEYTFRNEHVPSLIS